MFVNSDVPLLLGDLMKQSDNLFTNFVNTTLSIACCLYPAQCFPSTLYDSVYVVTLSSLLYRP